MDATEFKIGDKVKLVAMDEPSAEAHIGAIGTVTGIAPKPINVLNVDWNDGFGLNPCLDADMVTKV